MKHYYNLQRYAGPSSRHTCPGCGRPRCFTLYVDPDGNPLHETVALVESEKTAIICAALMPQYLWLSTGGKSQFNNRLASFKGRKIIAFPDIDAYHDWLRRTADFPHLDLKVSDLLEKNATPKARAAHIDLADWLIEFLINNK